MYSKRYVIDWPSLHVCNDSQHPTFENVFLSFTLCSLPTTRPKLLTDLNRLNCRLTALQNLKEHLILHTQLDN